jgi:hypothetical protein
MGQDRGYHHKCEAQTLSYFNQIDERARSESLRPIGVLALEPAELAKRYGLRFCVDERDGSTAAMLETRPGHEYMLLRHFDAPGPGTEVLASELSNDPQRDLGELLRALELDPQLVTWKLDREQARASQIEQNQRRRRHPPRRRRAT